MNAPCRIRRAGDSVVVVELEARIDPAINARAVALARGVRDRSLDGVRDVVTSYRSVAIYLDPLRADLAALERLIEELADPAVPAEPEERPIRTLAVRYGGAQGPDLDTVAELAGCDRREVVARHAGSIYRVYMMGFVPGFAYMGIVDPRIQVPRLPSPRLRVPAGSVALAGAQTGIYPMETPGGWRLIGRTAVTLFDPARERPFLLAVGDRVRFEPIGELR